jgi:hypothetical protein
MRIDTDVSLKRLIAEGADIPAKFALFLCFRRRSDMKPLRRLHPALRIVFVGIASFFTLVTAEVLPLRLDLYDASDNALMFITFEYQGGVNVGRTVYMADSTFIRHVAINRGGDGARTSEVSYNFNDDTSFVTSYRSSGGTPEFGIVDQFRVDQVGGAVSYATTDGVSFDLTFRKTGERAVKMTYEKDGSGKPTTVSVIDKNGILQYYGVFTNGEMGVTTPRVRGAGAALVSVVPRGARRIELQAHLTSAGVMRCELVTLSGRIAGTLFSGVVQPGFRKVGIRLEGEGVDRVAEGIYLLTVSVDGVTESRSRYLYQNTVLGGGK